eukprot:ANDGO_06250.mRNA.1 hypothetical protein
MSGPLTLGVPQSYTHTSHHASSASKRSSSPAAARSTSPSSSPSPLPSSQPSANRGSSKAQYSSSSAAPSSAAGAGAPGAGAGAGAVVGSLSLNASRTSATASSLATAVKVPAVADFRPKWYRMDDDEFDDEFVGGNRKLLTPRMEELANTRSRLEIMFVDQQQSSLEHTRLLMSIQESLSAAQLDDQQKRDLSLSALTDKSGTSGSRLEEGEDISMLLDTPREVFDNVKLVINRAIGRVEDQLIHICRVFLTFFESLHGKNSGAAVLPAVLASDSVAEAMAKISEIMKQGKMQSNQEVQTELVARNVRDLRKSERSFTVSTQTEEMTEANVLRFQEFSTNKLKREIESSKKAYAELHRLYRAQLKEIEYLEQEMGGMQQYLQTVDECYNRTVDEMMEFERLRNRADETITAAQDPRVSIRQFFSDRFMSSLSGSISERDQGRPTYTARDIDVLTRVQRKFRVVLDRVRCENEAFAAYRRLLNGRLGRQYALSNRGHSGLGGLAVDLKQGVRKVYRQIAAIHKAQAKKEHDEPDSLSESGSQSSESSKKPIGGSALQRQLTVQQQKVKTLVSRNDSGTNVLASVSSVSMEEDLSAQLEEFRNIWRSVGTRIQESSHVVRGALRKGFFWVSDTIRRLETLVLQKSARVEELQAHNRKLEKAVADMTVKVAMKETHIHEGTQTSETVFIIMQSKQKRSLASQTLESFHNRPNRSNVDERAYVLVGGIATLNPSSSDAGVTEVDATPFPQASSKKPSGKTVHSLHSNADTPVSLPALANPGSLSSRSAGGGSSSPSDPTSVRSLPGLRRQGTIPQKTFEEALSPPRKSKAISRVSSPGDSRPSRERPSVSPPSSASPVLPPIPVSLGYQSPRYLDDGSSVGHSPGRSSPGRTSPNLSSPGRSTPGRASPGISSTGKSSPVPASPGRSSAASPVLQRVNMSGVKAHGTEPSDGPRTRRTEGSDGTPRINISGPVHQHPDPPRQETMAPLGAEGGGGRGLEHEEEVEVEDDRDGGEANADVSSIEDSDSDDGSNILPVSRS